MAPLKPEVESIQITDEMRERFASKVDRSGDCWAWSGHRSAKGYGRFYLSRLAFLGAHRFAWIMENGPIPDGLHVLHRCDNPPCVNPAHLFLGTNADNTADKVAKGRCRMPPVRRGERHHEARLTAEAVVEIRQAYAAGGVSYQDLAERFGVHNATISRAVNRKYWSHVIDR